MKNLQLKWLREQMGLVSQEPALFATTISENILLGKEDANMNQIIDAAKAANAHSFIEELPDGYLTQVSIVKPNFKKVSTFCIWWHQLHKIVPHCGRLIKKK